jgi:dolichol-phosphate mannosyltransferase
MLVRHAQRADMAMSDAPRLSVFIMAWNEEKNLEGAVQELAGELATLGPAYELVIIDDGSSDGTSALADALAARTPHTRVVHHGDNRGLGGVYRTGFTEARGEWLTFFPADRQFPASIVRDYWLATGTTDLILGYLPQRDGPLSGRLLSLGERALLRLLFGRFPRFQGILMFRRSLLAGMPLHSSGRGWTVLMEFILRAVRTGARAKSVPITLRPRASGASKVTNLKSIASNLRQVLALRLYL